MSRSEQRRNNRIDKAKYIITYLDSGLVDVEHRQELIDGADRLLTDKSLTHRQQVIWGFYSSNHYSTKDAPLINRDSPKKKKRKSLAVSITQALDKNKVKAHHRKALEEGVQRLISGKNLTPSQAGIWGHYRRLT